MALLGFIGKVFAPVRRYFLHQSMYDELTDLGPLTPLTQNQLLRVYLTIFAALACCSLGSKLNLYWKIGGTITIAGFVGMSAWFRFTPRWREGRRVCLLMVAAFLLGVSLYPMITYCLIKIDYQDNSKIFHLIDLFFTIDESHLSNAFIGIAVVFCSFAMVAYFIESRYYTYSMGMIISANVLLCWLRSHASDPFKPFVIIGFFLFMLYVAAYSQEIVIQFQKGNTYCTQHAIALFTQLPAFLVHITYSWVMRPRRVRMPNDVEAQYRK